MNDPRHVTRGFGLKKAISDKLARDYHSPLVERMRRQGFRLDVEGFSFRLASEFGFCYGVDRAVEYVYETREKYPGRRIFVTGEIIHNPGVNRHLSEMGVRFLDEKHGDASLEEVREDDVVVLPAFGVPLDEFEALRRLKVILVDTTCGSVLNVWKNVENYARDGFTALIHGKYDHEETRATVSRALKYPHGHYLVVRDLDEARVVSDSIEGKGSREIFFSRFARAVSPGFDPDRHLDRLGCANQTTVLSEESMAIAALIREAMIRRHGAEALPRRFRAFGTICSATQERQDALRALLRGEKLDFMIVIGGYNSSNTNHLVEIASGVVPTYHIEGASCLESVESIRHQPLESRSEVRTAGWLRAGPLVVGLTAGASTPDSEIDAVIRRTASLRGVSIAG